MAENRRLIAANSSEPGTYLDYSNFPMASNAGQRCAGATARSPARTARCRAPAQHGSPPRTRAAAGDADSAVAEVPDGDGCARRAPDAVRRCIRSTAQCGGRASCCRDGRAWAERRDLPRHRAPPAPALGAPRVYQRLRRRLRLHEDVKALFRELGAAPQSRALGVDEPGWVWRLRRRHRYDATPALFPDARPGGAGEEQKRALRAVIYSTDMDTHRRGLRQNEPPMQILNVVAAATIHTMYAR